MTVDWQQPLRFFKQRYITLEIKAIVPGYDRTYPKPQMCRFFAAYTFNKSWKIFKKQLNYDLFMNEFDNPRTCIDVRHSAAVLLSSVF